MYIDIDNKTSIFFNKMIKVTDVALENTLINVCLIRRTEYVNKDKICFEIILSLTRNDSLTERKHALSVLSNNVPMSYVFKNSIYNLKKFYSMIRWIGLNIAYLQYVFQIF